MKLIEFNSGRSLEIHRALNQHRVDLLSRPGVTGTGIGIKQVGGLLTDDVSLAVFVRQKGPVPQAELIPKTLAGVETDVVQADFRAMFFGNTYENPLLGGLKISNFRNGLTYVGTLGALVKDGSGRYGLTNFHVIPGYGRVVNEADVFQPNYDQSSFFLGVGVRGKLNNKVDATLVPTGNRGASPRILNLGWISGTSPVVLGQVVSKAGRTTGVTAGTISAISTSVLVTYASGVDLIFTDCFLVTAEGFIGPGDSGSVAVKLQGGGYVSVVGLLFAGNETLGVGTPIQTVFSELGVTLLTVDDIQPDEPGPEEAKPEEPVAPEEPNFNSQAATMAFALLRTPNAVFGADALLEEAEPQARVLVSLQVPGLRGTHLWNRDKYTTIDQYTVGDVFDPSTGLLIRTIETYYGDASWFTDPSNVVDYSVQDETSTGNTRHLHHKVALSIYKARAALDQIATEFHGESLQSIYLQHIKGGHGNRFDAFVPQFLGSVSGSGRELKNTDTYLGGSDYISRGNWADQVDHMYLEQVLPSYGKYYPETNENLQILGELCSWLISNTVSVDLDLLVPLNQGELFEADLNDYRFLSQFWLRPDAAIVPSWFCTDQVFKGYLDTENINLDSIYASGVFKEVGILFPVSIAVRLAPGIVSPHAKLKLMAINVRVDLDPQLQHLVVDLAQGAEETDTSLNPWQGPFHFGQTLPMLARDGSGNQVLTTFRAKQFKDNTHPLLINFMMTDMVVIPEAYAMDLGAPPPLPNGNPGPVGEFTWTTTVEVLDFEGTNLVLEEDRVQVRTFNILKINPVTE